MPGQIDPVQASMLSAFSQKPDSPSVSKPRPGGEAVGAMVLGSPLRGVHRHESRDNQPEGTCWNALNVEPYDQFGRARIAQRFGISKLSTVQLGGSTPVQGMIEVPNIIYPGGTVPGIVFDSNFSNFTLSGLTNTGGTLTGGGSATYNGSTIVVSNTGTIVFGLAMKMVNVSHTGTGTCVGTVTIPWGTGATQNIQLVMTAFSQAFGQVNAIVSAFINDGAHNNLMSALGVNSSSAQTGPEVDISATLVYHYDSLVPSNNTLQLLGSTTLPGPVVTNFPTTTQVLTAFSGSGINYNFTVATIIPVVTMGTTGSVSPASTFTISEL